MTGRHHHVVMPSGRETTNPRKAIDLGLDRVARRVGDGGFEGTQSGASQD